MKANAGHKPLSGLIAEARAHAATAREYLDRHHATRGYTEIMRNLRVTLEECAEALEQRSDRGTT